MIMLPILCIFISYSMYGMENDAPYISKYEKYKDVNLDSLIKLVEDGLLHPNEVIDDRGNTLLNYLEHSGDIKKMLLSYPLRTASMYMENDAEYLSKYETRYKDLKVNILIKLLEGGSLHPYKVIDDYGNTLLHHLAYNGDIERVLGVLPYYPIRTVYNYTNKFPRDLVNEKLQELGDISLKNENVAQQQQRLIACKELLQQADHDFSDQSIEIIKKTKWGKCGFIQLLAKAIHTQHKKVAQLLFTRYKNKEFDFVLNVQDYDEINLYITTWMFDTDIIQFISSGSAERQPALEEESLDTFLKKEHKKIKFKVCRKKKGKK